MTEDNCAKRFRNYSTTGRTAYTETSNRIAGIIDRNLYSIYGLRSSKTRREKSWNRWDPMVVPHADKQINIGQSNKIAIDKNQKSALMIDIAAVLSDKQKGRYAEEMLGRKMLEIERWTREKM